MNPFIENMNQLHIIERGKEGIKRNWLSNGVQILDETAQMERIGKIGIRPKHDMGIQKEMGRIEKAQDFNT